MLEYFSEIGCWDLVKYGSYASIIYLWYKLYKCDRQYVRKYFYDKGNSLSWSMKSIKYWDQYVEPFIIKEFGILFTAGNSFIKGLISDNENTKEVNAQINEMNDQIKEELETTNETTNSIMDDDNIVFHIESREINKNTDKIEDENNE